MCSTWNALRENSSRAIATADAEIAFDDLGDAHAEFDPFDTPGELVAYLNTPGGDPALKNRIYRTLVGYAQDPSSVYGALAHDLLWLGLWPGLDAVFGRRCRDCVPGCCALGAALAHQFLEVLGRLDLDRVHRVASTLVANTERCLRDAHCREWTRMRREVELDEATLDGALNTDRRDLLSELGVPSWLEGDQEIAALRSILAELVGDDADLLLGAAVYGYSQRELGKRLGLSRETVRYRYERAVAQVRRHLEMH
jgi:hypothetical protein